jgi:hypothetical protein
MSGQNFMSVGWYNAQTTDTLRRKLSFIMWQFCKDLWWRRMIWTEFTSILYFIITLNSLFVCIYVPFNNAVKTSLYIVSNGWQNLLAFYILLRHSIRYVSLYMFHLTTLAVRPSIQRRIAGWLPTSEFKMM